MSNGLKGIFLFLLISLCLTTPALADDSTVILTNTAIEYSQQFNRPLVLENVGVEYEISFNRSLVLENVGVEYEAPFNRPLVLENVGVEYEAPFNRPLVLENVGVEYEVPFNRPLVLTNFAIEYELPLGAPPEGAITIQGGAETTATREVTIVISATDATHFQLLTEDRGMIDSQPLLTLPAPDAEGRSETAVVFVLSAGSGMKTIYTRLVGPGGASDIISDSIEAVLGRPDLTIPEIEFSTKEVYPGYPAQVFVRVRNDGTGDVHNADVHLLLDGNPFGDAVIDTVPTGGNGARASFRWDTPVYGIHLLQATVAPHPCESDTSNNSRSRLVIVGQLDVAGFIQVQAAFGNGLLTKTAYTGARVRVVGSAQYDPELTFGLPVTGAAVTIEDATGRVFGTGHTDGQGNFDIGFAAPREVALYALRVIVSDGSAGGSFGDILLTVEPLEGIEIVVYDEEVLTDPNPSGQGETVTITALVRNLGTEGANNVRIRFLDEDIIMEDVILPYVAPGAADTVAITYAFPEVGVRQVTVIPDPLDVIPEALELMGISDWDADPPQIVVPDRELEAKDIDMSPLPPRVNSPVTLTAKILNLGLTNHGSGAKIRYSENGNAIQTVTLAADIPSTSPPTEATAPSVQFTPGIIGDHLISFTIFGIPDWSNVNNNYEEYTYVWPELPGDTSTPGTGPSTGPSTGPGTGPGASLDSGPIFGERFDPAVTRIDIQNLTNPIDGERLFYGDNFSASATVRNIGDSPAPGTWLRLEVNGVPSGSIVVPPMNPWEVLYLSINGVSPIGPPNKKGDVYPITMKLDNVIDEESTANNGLTRQKAVFNIQASGRAAAIFFTTSPENIEGVAVGQPVSAHILVENIGRYRTSGMMVHFYADGETLASVPITMLEGGETILVEHRFAIDHAGFVTVQAVLEIDPENDLDLTDNSISRILAVGSLMDIRLLSFTAPDTGLPWEEEPLAVTVRNAGDIGLRGLEVAFYNGFSDTTQRLGRVAFDLSPGQTASGTFDWIPGLVSGDVAVTAIADPYHFFPEADRSDNLLTSIISFPSAPAAPVITAPLSGSLNTSETIAIQGTAEPAAWLRIYVDGLMAGVTRADTVSGLFTIPLVRGEGSYTITATADRGGLISAPSDPVTVTVIFDSQPPRSTLTIGQPHYGTEPTYITSTSLLVLNAVDDLATIGDGLGLGVDRIEYRIDGGDYLSYTAPFTLYSEGQHTVTYYATDILGNGEAEQTAELTTDNTAPGLALVVGEPKVEGDPVIISTITPISITALDIGVGLQAIHYAIDGGDWLPYSGAFTLASGEHTVTARALDLLNNEAETSLDLIVDMTPPTIVIAPVESPTNQDVTLADTVTDNVSAPENISVTGDNSPYTAEGEYNVTLTATDEAGNSASASVSFTIDKTAPETVLHIGSPQYAAYITSTTELSLSATDNLSGVSATQYRIDGGEWLPYSAPFTIATEGLHIVEYYSSDLASNNETAQTVSLSVDNTAPESVLSADLLSADGTIAIPETEITIIALDAGSGVGRIEYRINSGDWQSYTAPFELGSSAANVTIDYRAIDNLGNQEADQSIGYEVRAALTVSAGLLTTPRVLAWWNESRTVPSPPGGEGQGEGEEALVAILDSAALDYLIVDNATDFLGLLTDYNTYMIIGDKKNLNDAEDSMVAAQVARGKSILTFGYEDIKTPSEEDLGWNNIFGIKVAGVLNGNSLLALYQSELSDTRTIEVEAQTERITEVITGEVLGEVALIDPGEGGGQGAGHGRGGGHSADSYPALVANLWGDGKTLYLAPEYGRNPDALSELLTAAIAWAEPEAEVIAPGNVVGITVNVENAVLPLTLTIYVESILPDDSDAVRVYDGGTDQGSVVVWTDELPSGDNRDYRYLLRLPETEGPYLVRVEASYLKDGVYRLSATKELILE